MRYVVTFILLLAPCALASRGDEDKPAVPRASLRDSPQTNVVACTTLKGIREMQQIRAFMPMRPKEVVRTVNRTVPGAGCVFFPSVDYVEAEEIVEHIQMTGKVRLEVRYQRIIVMHAPSETFYIGSVRPFPTIVWETVPDLEESY